jgi:hypothetical protein
MTSPKITKAEILDAIVNYYWEDLTFIERLNNLTYHQKVTLKGLQKPPDLNQTTNDNGK